MKATLVILLLLGAVVWVAGIRIVTIQPIGALPEGVTAVVAGVSGVRLIDSPDAICIRHEGGVSLLCRGREAAAIAEHGTILLRLPFSSVLHRISGAH